MKKLALGAFLLAAACAAAQAGGSASATMEMSFVIRAACSVQAEGAAAPQVECTQGTGYQLVRRGEPAALTAQQPSSAAQVGEVWQVVF